MGSTRCFVAVDLQPPADTKVRRLIRQLQSRVENVRWTSPDQLHITVNFLGDIDDRELPSVCENIRQVCQDIEPFCISLKGLGTFPKGKPPRVVWAAVDQGAEVLAKMYSELDSVFASLGIPQEGKAYRPHVTLGRVGRGADRELLSETLAEVGPGFATHFEVDEVRLLASIRERGTVVHESLDTVEL